MRQQSRRQFLTDVGRGMLIAGVGPALATDMGLGSVSAVEPSDRLNFGPLEPLVALMQETPANKLLPLLAERLKDGTSLRELVAAGALANARTFGGEDYIGFHTMMALSPAYRMSQELPAERSALPVFKVLYRNTSRIQAKGGKNAEVLRSVKPEAAPEGTTPGDAFREAVRTGNAKVADGRFAAIADKSTDEAFNELLQVVQDDLEVHRVVLPYRAWDLLDVVGKEHAQTMLRQSVHYCSKFGPQRRAKPVRTPVTQHEQVLVKLFDQFKLLDKPLGSKPGDDAWVDQLSQTIFKSTAVQGAEAVAAALAEGFAPQVIGEAISLAANQLILREGGRTADNASDVKPVGSVHGDSIGVHGCDSANAWRNTARVSNARNTAASLILGAYQVVIDRPGHFIKIAPVHEAAVEKFKATEPEALLKLAEEAIRAKDQVTASAAVAAYGAQGHPHRPVFDLLLRFAVSEDGALHAEKYYRTVSEEFATTRPAFRWRQLVGLARVTASEFGQPAPGYAEACQLLKV
jgi:hypothetical protein